jgi:tetratricopeptide (TPR) repeat protein
VPSTQHYLRLALEHALTGYTGNYPREADVRPLAEALIALADDSAEAKRRVASLLLGLPLPGPVRALLGDDPHPEAAMIRVVAALQLADWEDAEEELARLETSGVDGQDREARATRDALLALHRVYIALRRGRSAEGTPLDRAAFGALLAEIDRCELLLTGQEALDRGVEVSIAADRAECFLRRGDAERALEILRVDDETERGPQWLLLLGDAHAALRRPDHARGAWSVLLDRYPFAPHARQARDRLLSLDRAPYR